VTSGSESAVRWTPARRRALDVFRGRSRGVRVSNVTDAAAGTIYWQSAAWLCAHGFARVTTVNSDFIEVTDAGVDALYAGRGRQR
jgi:hypothetical protein